MNTEVAPINNLSEVLRTLDASVAPSTQLAYTQALTTLQSRFSEKGWALYPEGEEGQLDASLFTQQLLSYLQERKDERVTLSTINKTVSALKFDASRRSPLALGLLNGELVSQFLAGLTRRHAREETPHKAHAFTVEQLHQVHAHLREDSRPRAVRDRALIAVGIAAALRASSISELKLKDVNRTRTYDGLLLRVRFSKTDQTANGVDIPVKAAPSSRICPVKALDAWLSVLEAQGITREANPEFPLFPVMRGEQVKHTEMKHPAVTITKLLRDTLVSAQIVSRTGSEAFSSHSLRSTFITLSSQKSIPAERIARVSQHQSLSILRGYDRTEIEAFGQAEYLA